MLLTTGTELPYSFIPLTSIGARLLGKGGGYVTVRYRRICIKRYAQTRLFPRQVLGRDFSEEEVMLR